MLRTLLLISVLLAAPLALAQDDADYNTTAPADDGSYATDSGTPDAAPAQATDSAPSDADLNATPPADDTSYLADDGVPAAATVGDAPATETPATATPAGATTPAAVSAPTAKAPGFEGVALLAAGLAALVIARRR